MIQIESIFEGSSAPNLQSKSVTYTANGANTITSDEGYDGLSSVDVTVDVSGGGGYIEDLLLESAHLQFGANDVRFNSCGFVYSDVLVFPTSTNVSFTNCTFLETHISCAQSIRDAIENDSSNTLNNVNFDIIQ